MLSRSIVVALVLAVVCIAGVSAEGHGATKLHALKARVEGSVKIGCVSNGLSGTCQSMASCRGSVVRGLCAGPSSIACCIVAGSRPSSPGAAGRVAAPVVVPAAVPMPAPQAVKPVAVVPVVPVVPQAVPAGRKTLADLLALAGASTCAAHTFTSQSKHQASIAGRPPKAFVRGVAATFAKAVCQPTRPDVLLAGHAQTNGDHDVLNNYKDIYAHAGLDVSSNGMTTLRNVFTLLFGLGMCESGGSWCTGRDMSSGFSTADSAEAGMFQTSWGSHVRDPQLTALMTKYQSNNAGCLAKVFQDGVKCSNSNLKNWGTGQGFDWQRRTKECPAFAVEYAAVLLRLSGGAKGEWMPLRRQYAELRPECSSMLQQVQTMVSQNPNICDEVLA